jgi:hypothetical protein
MKTSEERLPDFANRADQNVVLAATSARSADV